MNKVPRHAGVQSIITSLPARFGPRLLKWLLALAMVASLSDCAGPSTTIGEQLAPTPVVGSGLTALKVAIIANDQFTTYEVTMKNGLLGHEVLRLQPETTDAIKGVLAQNFESVIVLRSETGAPSDTSYLVYPSLDIANAQSESISGVKAELGLLFMEPQTKHVVAEFRRASLTPPNCVSQIAVQSSSSSAIPVVPQPENSSDSDACKSAIARVLANDLTLIAGDIRDSRAFAYARAGRQPAPLQATTQEQVANTSPPHVVQPQGPRVALVVGNSTYKFIPYLNNPSNDARLMAATLQSLGFTLVGDRAQINLDKQSFDHAIEDFSDRLRGSSIAVFYYAGHGVQVRGENYLVPIGANPSKESDVDFQMIPANSVLHAMQNGGSRLNIVILDACRNNPFGGRGIRSSGGGLAQMQAPEGTLISYATQPGNVASDGEGNDSPYTEALAQAIREPNLDIFGVFNEVGLIVKRKTEGAQQPWFSISPIEGDFYFTNS